MQAAVANIGAVYVSADVHDGWDALLDRNQGPPKGHEDLPVIPPPEHPRELGGHAFAVVGYNERGFVVQNSWGTGWAASGFAILPYDDWIEHSTDAWALALGVPVLLTRDGKAGVRIVPSSRWRVASGRSLTSVARSARNPDNPPDDPWPVDHVFQHKPYQPWSSANAYLHSLVSGNDGVLSVSDFTRAPDDMAGHAQEIAFDEPLKWQARSGGKTLRLAIYAHGGLNSEQDSIARTRVLAPYFEANGIYPLFLVWKTGIGETLGDIMDDCARKVFGPDGEAAGALFDYLAEKRDRAVEGFAHVLAKGLWTQMRENAEAGKAPRRALDLLAMNLAALAQRLAKDGKRLELHLAGHSAGSILLGHLLERMSQSDLKDASPGVRTCTLWAAACSSQFAVNHYIPAADNGILDLQQLWLHYLSDENEKRDGLPTPGMATYGKSLLYLVSRALDDARKMPLLGMQRALDPAYANDREQWADEELHWVQEWQARWSRARGIPESRPFVENTRDRGQIQATHGSFDNNIDVVTQTLARIRGAGLVKPMEWLDY